MTSKSHMPTAPSCIDNNKRSSHLNFSNTHWCSFPNGSVWLGVAESAAGRVVLLQLLSMHDGAVGMRDLDVMLLCSQKPVSKIQFHRWEHLTSMAFGK